MSKIKENEWQELLVKLREGKKVSELAESYGVSTQNIYARLGKESKPKKEILEYSKLKRECDDLRKLLGMVTYELSKEKKLV
jgi:hypothetical protein